MVLSITEVLQLWWYTIYNNDEFNTQFDFSNSEASDFCFAMQDDILVFDFHVFLKTLFLIMVGYLSTWQKSLQFSQSFAIFAKLYARQMNNFA